MYWLTVVAVFAALGFGWWLSSMYHKRRMPRQREPHFLDTPMPAPEKKAAKAMTARPTHGKWAGTEHRGSVSSASLPTVPNLDTNSRRLRIRDRYLGIRFDGLIRDSRDLKDTSKVIKAARLYFEDENTARADELLRLAVAVQPGEARLWLARLEIHFLSGEAERFTETARSYRRACPGGEEWQQVACLGRALAPGNDLFHECLGTEDDQGYGPWPNTPNWIEASWDLTADVAGADFHRHMRARLDRRRASASGAHR